jgi:hypothetical protein
VPHPTSSYQQQPGLPFPCHQVLQKWWVPSFLRSCCCLPEESELYYHGQRRLRLEIREQEANTDSFDYWDTFQVNQHDVNIALILTSREICSLNHWRGALIL